MAKRKHAGDCGFVGHGTDRRQLRSLVVQPNLGYQLCFALRDLHIEMNGLRAETEDLGPTENGFN